MNTINFLSRPSFPLSSDTLDFMLKMIRELGGLTALGGSSYILSGCKVSGSSVSDGYIVLNGELLFFKGGTLAGTFVVVENKRDIIALGETYPEVYTERLARFGSGSPQYNWNDLKPISDLLSLKAQLDTLSETVAGINAVPAGAVNMFVGTVPPNGWMICDGRSLLVADYLCLFNIIGYTNGGSGSAFRLPDLRGRFIVGVGQATSLNAGDSNPDYYINQRGGENTHLLTVPEIPPHTHNLPASVNGDGGAAFETDSYGHTLNSSSAGGGLRHENRPPYHSLNYIIKY